MLSGDLLHAAWTGGGDLVGLVQMDKGRRTRRDQNLNWEGIHKVSMLKVETPSSLFSNKGELVAWFLVLGKEDK